MVTNWFINTTDQIFPAQCLNFISIGTCTKSIKILIFIYLFFSSSNNCLKTTVSSNHQSLNSYLSINLGQSYSPDTQCKMVLGDASFACRVGMLTGIEYISLVT